MKIKRVPSIRRYAVLLISLAASLTVVATVTFMLLSAKNYAAAMLDVKDNPALREAAEMLLKNDRENLRLTLLIGSVWLVMVMALLGLTAWICVRWVIQPIFAAQRAAVSIAQGDYETRIALPRERNEIYALSVEMNNMAEKLAFAERTKLDFISPVSHELRTPLTAIKGWGETLQQGGALDGDLVRRGLGIIVGEAARLSHLVDELLDFSRMQSNRLTLRMEPIDVLAELDDVAYIFIERAARDGVALNTATSELPAPMMGDPARIRQIFVNLLDNAFKATPQGGTVTVTSDFTPQPPADRPPERPPELLHITIADTGCGVSEENLPHITEKFFKTSAATKGSGIGLAVVEELIKAHNGALAFESAPGEGLTVCVTFPLMTDKK